MFLMVLVHLYSDGNYKEACKLINGFNNQPSRLVQWVPAVHESEIHFERQRKQAVEVIFSKHWILKFHDRLENKKYHLQTQYSDWFLIHSVLVFIYFISHFLYVFYNIRRYWAPFVNIKQNSLVILFF